MPHSYRALRQRWTNSNMSKFNEDCHFYLLSRARTLLLFGYVYEENMYKKIENVLTEMEAKNGGLTVWIGKLNREKSNFKLDDRDILEQATDLLNSYYQPTYFRKLNLNPEINARLKIESENADSFLEYLIEGQSISEKG